MAAMYTKMVFAVAVLCAVSLSFGSAQETYVLDCPSVDTVEDLDMNKLAEGSWYEVKMVKLTGYTAIRPRCSMTTFGTDLSVTTEFEAPNKTAYTLTGHLKNVAGKGGFNITYDNIVTSGELPYNVLLADYDDIVVIFGCTQERHISLVNGWILSRSPVLSRQAEEKFEKKLESIGFTFPGLFYYDLDRSDCKIETATKTPATPAKTPSNTESTPRNEPTKPAETPVNSSPNADDHDSTPQTSPQPTIKVVFAGETQGESWGYIRSLLAAQWSMLVALLLLSVFVVMSALAVYRMLLPFLRAHHRDEARTLVLSHSESNTKKSGHYNDGLEVDV